MKDRLEEIVGVLKGDLGAWLDHPGEAELGLESVQKQLDALRSTLGAKAVAEASRALRGSKKTARAARQREAAEAVSAALRELGIRVEPGAPMKRVHRKKSNNPVSSPEVVAETGAPHEPTVAAEAPEPEHRSFLSRRRTTP